MKKFKFPIVTKLITGSLVLVLLTVPVVIISVQALPWQANVSENYSYFLEASRSVNDSLYVENEKFADMSASQMVEISINTPKNAHVSIPVSGYNIRNMTNYEFIVNFDPTQYRIADLAEFAETVVTQPGIVSSLGLTIDIRYASNGVIRFRVSGPVPTSRSMILNVVRLEALVDTNSPIFVGRSLIVGM